MCLILLTLIAGRVYCSVICPLGVFQDVVARLAAMEQYSLTGTPQQFTDHIKAQTERWAAVIQSANIKVD